MNQHATTSVSSVGLLQQDGKRKKAASKLAARLNRSFQFRFFLLLKMPIAWLAGMKVEYIDFDQCIASMPFRWLSQNPFKSIYFATQAMSAELSTGALAMLAVEGCEPSVAMLITNMQASYTKKATQTVFYKCEEGAKLFEAVARAQSTGEGQTVTVETVGSYKDGTEVSRFKFTWSFKVRS